MLDNTALKDLLSKNVWSIDKKTLEIRAAEFTTSEMGDASMLPELLDQIPPEQEIGSVTADGAYDTRKYHDAIAARGAAAIIPPRKNAILVDAVVVARPENHVQTYRTVFSQAFTNRIRPPSGELPARGASASSCRAFSRSPSRASVRRGWASPSST